MSKLWQIAAHEYSRHVLRKRFLFALLSVPIFLFMLIGLIILIFLLEINSTPIGYVDQSGLLANPLPQPEPSSPEKLIPMVQYADEAAARAALQAGEIQGYYIVPEDYLLAGQVTQVYLEAMNRPAEDQFNDFLTVNLLASQPAEVSQRILQGSQLVVRSADQRRETSQSRVMDIMMPFFIGLIFFAAMNTSSGYLLQAVVEEKENRMMEVMVTSASPTQIMAGKIIGDIAIGLTQLVGWIGFSILGILIGRNYIKALQEVSLNPDLVLITLVIMLPALVLVCALMAMVGATVTESREGQQVMGLFLLPIYIPFLLLPTMMENAGSPLAVGLSLFPLTAPLAMALRIGFSVVPTWQIALSSLVLILSAICALWLAGRAFRLGMLRYGQRLRLNEIFQRQRA